MDFKFLKRSLTIVATLFVALALIACTDDTPTDTSVEEPNDTESGDTDSPPVSDEEIVLNISGFNEQFQQRFEAVVDLPDNVSVNWIINSHDIYQYELARMLPNGEVDLFVAEIQYIQAFTSSDLVADVHDFLTEEETANMFEYNRIAATGDDGVLRGVSWEANPGLFVYRRSIAREVFGTDDPDVIQGYVQDWDAFSLAAERVGEHGHTMIAGWMDTWNVFSNNISGPWVNENNEIIVDEHMMEWIDRTEYLLDNGYATRGVEFWDAAWSQGVNPGEGNPGVFGYFHAPWGISFVMRDQSLDDQDAPHEYGNGTYGDWAAVHGPASFFWGGTWILASTEAASDPVRAELIRTIMYEMTVNEDKLTELAHEFNDLPNNVNVVNRLADSDFESSFLGGQNHIALLADSVHDIEVSHLGPFDQAMTESFQQAGNEVFEGNLTREEALDQFFDRVITSHPHLIRPE